MGRVAIVDYAEKLQPRLYLVKTSCGLRGPLGGRLGMRKSDESPHPEAPAIGEAQKDARG
jgi:hypothetical protein